MPSGVRHPERWHREAQETVGPQLQHEAASTAEPPVGASTCTSGSQVCTGHIGTYGEGREEGEEQQRLSAADNGSWCQVAMSKLPPDWLYRYTRAMSISSEPSSV